MKLYRSVPPQRRGDANQRDMQFRCIRQHESDLRFGVMRSVHPRNHRILWTTHRSRCHARPLRVVRGTGEIGSDWSLIVNRVSFGQGRWRHPWLYSMKCTRGLHVCRILAYASAIFDLD